MDSKLRQDLNWFFRVYQDRTSNLVKALPILMQKEFDEEVNLLKESIMNRLAQDLGR